MIRQQLTNAWNIQNHRTFYIVSDLREVTEQSETLNNHTNPSTHITYRLYVFQLVEQDK